MPLRPFLTALQESGRVRVGRPPEPPDVEEAGVSALLLEFDRSARRDMPHTAPEFNPVAASWAAVRLYRACQFLVFRDLGAELASDQILLPCPAPVSPSVTHSADLTLRYLPEVIVLARGISPGDPLLVALHQLARQWPYSSVGVAGLAGVDPGPVLDHPSLRQTYVDRILERRDVARLDRPAVREAVRETLGFHPDLCPEISAALAGESVEKRS